MKAQRRALEEAHSTFNAAETEAVRLKRRVDEIATKLTHARSAASRLVQDLGTFAASDEPLDALAGKARSAAREAAISRAETDAEIQFLESALAQATAAWNRARAKIVIAERGVLTALRAHVDAQLDELMDGLWTSARVQIRKLLDSAHVGSFLACYPDMILANSHAVCRVDSLLETLVATRFQQLADTDDGFRTLPDPVAQLAKTTQLTSEDRGRITHHDGEDEVAAKLGIVTPAHVESRDPARARDEIAWIDRKLPEKEAALADMRGKRGSWSWRKPDPDSVDRIEAEIAHLKTVREAWAKHLIAA